MDDIKWFKWLLWGCTQMICGVLVMLGGLLILLVGTQNAGMLVLIGFIVLLVGLVLLLAGYFERVRPALRENYDNK